MSYSDGFIFGLCSLITIGFQITSNFANDYGDGIKGTDADDRVGPKRALQSGALTASELRWGISITALLSIFLTLTLLVYVFGVSQLPYFFIFLVLSIFSIWAAIKYTIGKSAYGYRGLGDVFVFLFFGLLAVLGIKFLYLQHIDYLDILPATAIGLLCVGVLNLNNLRDIQSDTNHEKNTLVVKLGYSNGKIYHAMLLIISFFCFLIYSILKIKHLNFFWFLLPYLFILTNLIKIVRIKNPVHLDSELKKLALATFTLSLLFYIVVNYFL